MYGGKQTLYDVLELRRNATEADVARAYARMKAEMAKGMSTPDPRRIALLHEAHEVLSDPQRRAEYDKSLKDSKFFGRKAGVTPRIKWAGVIAGIAVAAIALYLVLRPTGPPQWKAQEYLAAASSSVGRLQSLDVSGRAKTVGHAVAVEPGVMATTCHGIVTGALLVVQLETRTVPVRVSMADGKLDICRLAGEDVGNQAPRFGGDLPKAGDKVFTVNADASGKLGVAAGTVKELVASADGQVIEITIPIAPDASGGPLFDSQGRLIGLTAAPHAYGEGRHIALPAAWIREARSRAATRGAAKSGRP